MSDDGRYRKAEEVSSAILEVADKSEGATKLEIMASAFITHETATGHLDKLQHNGLIEYHAITNSYHITERGRDEVR